MPFYPDGVNRANLARADASTNSINTPGPSSITDSPGLQGSMQQVLMENLGQYVQIDFLVGISTLVRRSGILYSVGRSYVVLYDETQQDFILCDVFSAKFINFFGKNPPSTNQSLGLLAADAQGNLRPVLGGDPRVAGQGGLPVQSAGFNTMDPDRYFDQGFPSSARTLGDG